MVKFTIHTSYVQSFVSDRNNQGGVMVAAKNEETGEAGWLYVCHASSLNTTLCERAKWIMSCWLPSKYDNKSPFKGGNSNNKVKSTFDGVILTIELVPSLSDVVSNGRIYCTRVNLWSGISIVVSITSDTTFQVATEGRDTTQYTNTRGFYGATIEEAIERVLSENYARFI